MTATRAGLPSDVNLVVRDGCVQWEALGGGGDFRYISKIKARGRLRCLKLSGHES